MKAVIFAGGGGQRMQPLSKRITKQMLRVHGIPMLEHVINILPKKIDEVIFLVSSDKDRHMRNHFGKKFKGKKITYLFDINTKKLRGTWMPVKRVKGMLKKGEQFLLLCGDDMYTKKALADMVKYGQEAVLGFYHSNPERFGVLHIDGKKYLQKLEEKPIQPITNLVSTGAYVLSKKFLESPDPDKINNEYRLTDVVENYIKQNKIKVIVTKDWLSITNPTDFIEAHNSKLFDY